MSARLWQSVAQWWERFLDSLERMTFDFGAGASGASLTAGEPSPSSDPVVSRAYPGIVDAQQELRDALADVAAELGLSPVELSDVIQSESGWDPRAPRERKGTPRGGLLQLTVGANLPGYQNAEAVWALREMPGDRQLREVFAEFLRRQKLPRNADAYRIYKSVFLPAYASKPAEFVLCDLSPDDPRHDDDKWCKANPGFDRNKDGRIQWLEVFERINEVRRSAKGRFVTRSGKVVDQAEEVHPPIVAEDAPGPAPAVLALRAAVNAQWPDRPKASDGIMGDLSHQRRKSDHNDGNAIDFTRGPKGPDTRALIGALLRDPRTKYVIHESKLYKPGAEAADFSGPGKDPHNRHLHLSIKPESRNDVRPWDLTGVGVIPAAGGRAAEAIREGLPWAMRAGIVDSIVWVPLQFEELVLTVAAEFLSVEGVRIPLSWSEELELCRAWGWMPPTVAVVDRRWELADRRLVFTPEVPKDLRTEAGIAQVLRVNAALPPVAPAVLAEGPKAWVFDPAATKTAAVNYGLFRPDGTVWQSPGHKHDANWKDYSQMFAPVQRKATLGGNEIDLLERARSRGKYNGALLDFLGGA